MKRLLLLLFFYDEFFTSLEWEDGEDRLHKVHVDDAKYMIQTQRKGAKLFGKRASLNVGEKMHGSGHGDTGVHSNGNDYLAFNNLPDYLTHLKKVVDKKLKEDKDTKRKGYKAEHGNDYLESDNLPDYLSHLKKEVGKKVREEEDAKRKGGKTEHLNVNTDNVDVKVAKGMISNGNDNLEFNNLPDYLTHLKKEVDKKVREEKDAKRKGSATERI